MIELANYNKVVAQRNKLLKEISFSGRMADTLEIWDEQMVRYGTSIISERKKFISRLNDILSEIHQNLTGRKEQILITYLLQSIHSIQTLITCTGLDEFVENHFEANSVFQVVEGSVFHKETGGI